MADKEFVYGDGLNSTFGENTQRHFYDRTGIEAASAFNIYSQFADRRSMPTKRGKTFKIARFQHIYDRDLNDTDFAKYGFLTGRDVADVTKGLNDIVLPEGSGRRNLVNFQKVNLECSFQRIGEMLEYTDEVELFSEDSIQIRYREELGALAGQRIEDLVQLDMLSTGNVLYPYAATSLATMGNGITADGSLDDEYRISHDFIRKCVAKLKRNRAKKNSQVITGSVKIGTRPVAESYYAIIPPQVKFDLETAVKSGKGVAEFAYIPYHLYPDGGKSRAMGEVGRLHEVSFIEGEDTLIYKGKGVAVPENYTGNLSYTGEIGNDAKFDVFPVLFPTAGSFATVGLKGQGKIKFYSKPPSDVDLTNPYGTKGFFSYSAWYAGIILQEEKLLKGLVLATAV